VFLKALTLKGFKSFADTTVMQLEPGVTVVVGPNGSGKSNVVDAIAWVLGAQAPSAVRSQKMDDVIFAGTAKRPALGRAEVILTLDNSSGLLPIEFNEVTISRTLFRTGESEYAINGVNCRLLDVQELLSDAGVGRQQHVIVSQGQIDAVLNARPEDRRAIIEEAAGVLKYRRRKEKAERRLDATEASLLRVQDLLREVRRQLRPLERQAEAAQRHGSLIAELQALKVFLAGREISSLRIKLTASAGDRISSQQSESALKTELSRLDTEVFAAEAEMTARGDTDISDELVRVEQLRERAKGLSAVLVERRRSMERDRGQLMNAGVVANLENDAARLAEELAAVVEDLAQFEPAAERLTEEDEQFALERRETLAVLQSAASPSTAASAVAEVRGELRSLRSGLERGEAELRRQNARLDTLAQRTVKFESDIVRMRAEIEQSQAVEEPLVAQVAEAEARRLESNALTENLTTARQSAAEDVSRWKARKDALQMALDSARARAGAQRLANLDGVVGTLLELVEIDQGWEPAVEAAMGEALLAVVVANPNAAKAALQSLRSAKTSGAVMALGLAVDSRITPAVGEAVRSHVRAHSAQHGAQIEALLDGLLGGAVRVSSWNEAVELALTHPTATVVTDDGDRFGVSGWRLGVSGGGATAAALEEAITQAASAAAELGRIDGELSVAKAESNAARQAETDLTRQLDANDAKFTAASEGLARVQADRREIAAEVETAERTVAEASERVEREKQRISELDGLVPALEADEAAENAAARARGEARARIEARAAQLASQRKDLEVRNAGLHERQLFLERRIEETERRLQADAVARSEAAQQRQSIERSLLSASRLADLVDVHRQTIEGRLAELHDQRRRQSEEVRALAARLDGYRRARVAAERQLDESRERARRIELEETEVRVRLEAAIETLRRELDLEPEVAEAAEMPVLPEGVSAASRVRDLDRELRLLGPINPLALEEFTELQERHRFLEEQLEDVRNTRRELAKVIKAVDFEIQTVFAAAFEDVSINFTSLFGMLFPGGTGALVLTHPDDLLNTGIEVEAKPSGKNVKKLSLLSGGERSLTALAYLFAVFRSRPSPFYVMDEVEAALDDVNLHRFLSLIAEFRRDAQLLIVSHQKRTMEAGDSLLGVSMQPGGSSKLITERRSSIATASGELS
jgi:chromosome segregation protein